MIWSSDISFEYFFKKIDDWNKNTFIGDLPIDAQFALDLIFKTLIDDKENFEYLTTIPESVEQTNSIMLDLILTKYSKKYRKFKKTRRQKMNNHSDLTIKDLKTIINKLPDDMIVVVPVVDYDDVNKIHAFRKARTAGILTCETEEQKEVLCINGACKQDLADQIHFSGRDVGVQKVLFGKSMDDYRKILNNFE